MNIGPVAAICAYFKHGKVERAKGGSDIGKAIELAGVGAKKYTMLLTFNHE